MARVLITGSTDGIGLATAEALIEDGHRAAVHARTTTRLAAVEHLTDRGAESITGDLANLDEVASLVEQANRLGCFDAVIHNAGTMSGPVLPVNVTAPYVMTARWQAYRS
ncbi:SDR family NAD(P)-dependent oxidoreductase [Nocardia australiensis]|uniref:SDR family NAD(P)-dependent oxidoreductase n=1 Tax=Nocardia australiensis TaxID=2887191 RepID=UPI001D14AD91|nr:SDR family NAD(P)-dependent oxidoreductase [Nocardia australiensis]